MPSTFIAAKPDMMSRVLIQSYAKTIGLENLISSTDLHCTIMYSKMLPTLPYPKIYGLFSETAKCFRICYIGNAIAILLISDFLRQRNTVASACGLRSNFPGLIPHISIQYCENDQKNMNLSILPQPEFSIRLVKEIVVIKDE